MNEIICPHCGKAFKIDEAGYADILKQVRDADFEKQLHERLELAEQDKRNAIELAEAKLAGELQKAAAAKDTEIQTLKAKLDAGDVARKLAVTEALSAVEKERDALANELAQARQENEAAARLALRYGCPVLLKGGHLAGDCRDVLAGPDGRMLGEWNRLRVRDVSTHGTGCSLSAAIAARLAAGDGLATAVERGLEFIASSIRNHLRWEQPVRVDALKLW